MQRRTFVFNAAALAAGLGLAACRPPDRPQLTVQFLERSIPPQLIKVFRKQLEQPITLNFEASAQLIALFAQLKQWQSDSAAPPLWRRWLPWLNDAPADLIKTADWLTLSDYWLTSAVQQKLVQPIEITDTPAWQTFPKDLQQLMRRNNEGELDNRAPIYGAPYRVQSLMLVYHRSFTEQVGQQPDSWADLWRPELRGRIALPNHPQLLLGIVLKSLGYSINQGDNLDIEQVKTQLSALHRQIKVYDSSTYLKALINEDVSLAVGWSSDILATLSRYPQLRAVFPPEGSILSCDLWVRPIRAEALAPESLSQQWINFCWQPAVATQISLSSRGFSPLFLGQSKRPPALQTSQNLPNPKSLANSEFLQPLSANRKAIYDKLLNVLKVDQTG
ncbi:MAG: extracellular solute-binding protein [Cyanobacteria bacterium P01_A01_bin.114]